MNLEKMRSWIADGNTDAIENAWMEAVEGGEPLDVMRGALEALVQADGADTAHTLAWMLLSDAVDSRSPEQALKVAQAILPALPGNQELRDTAVDLYRKVHGEAEHFEEFLRASGLALGQSLRRAVRTLDTCLNIGPGDYLANRYDHTVAKLESFDPVMGQFSLASPDRGTLELEPKLLADEYDRVEETDFRVLCQFGGDRLAQVLQKDLAQVLSGVCMSRGGSVNARELKDLLVPQYIESGQWSSWWNRARTAARKSDSLSVEGRNPIVISYHPGGRTLEEELSGAAKGATQPLEHYAVLQQYVREARHRGLTPEADFVAPILKTLAKQAETFRRRRPLDALSAALTLEAAESLGLPGALTEYPSAADALRNIEEPAEAVASIEDSTLWEHALAAMASLDDAGPHLERLLTLAPANRLDDVASRIREAGCEQAIPQILNTALVEPGDHIDICVWLWNGPAEPVEGTLPLVELLTRLLNAMEELNRRIHMDRERRRLAFQLIRASLVAGDCRRFREALEGLDPGVAQTLRRRIEWSPGLSPSSVDALIAVLREKFYALFLKARVEPWLDENVIWTTQEGLDNQEAALKELQEITIPANSKAVGAAAALGDLSENSEWQYAVEEQRRLQARESRMRNELVMARVLHPGDVPTDSVGIGSRVIVRNVEGGAEVALTFLGPWDTNVDQWIFNYQTPLGQSFMGKKIGDTSVLKMENASGEHEIVRIESAL
jgi:transcription elongation factor GreA